MTTTRKELGEVCATGKPIQERFHNNMVWEDMKEDDCCFDLETCDYRLKPVTTYYRVYKRFGAPEITTSAKPFDEFESWKAGFFGGITVKHIHDFEKEES